MTTVDPTTITATITTDRDRMDPTPAVDSWWAVATGLGLDQEATDRDTYDYDEHMTIDQVSMAGCPLDVMDDRLDGTSCGQVFGWLGRFYAVAVDTTGTVHCLRLDVNDACPCCGNEADLAPVDCNEHRSEYAQRAELTCPRTGATVLVTLIYDRKAQRPEVQLISETGLDGHAPGRYWLTTP